MYLSYYCFIFTNPLLCRCAASSLPGAEVAEAMDQHVDNSSPETIESVEDEDMMDCEEPM